MSELKPCPFCGGEAATETHNLESTWSVICSGCTATLPFVAHTEAEAIAAWNTRSHEADKSAAVREAVERTLLATVDAIRDYLPPDGISAHAALARIIDATDNPEINPIIAEIENGRA